MIRRAAAWFTSPERWFQTRRSIDSYREQHQSDTASVCLLWCSANRDTAAHGVPDDVHVIYPDDLHGHYRENANRVGMIGGHMRPALVEYLFRMGFGHVMAFDGDTEFFAPIDDLWQTLNDFDAIATPHRLYAPPRDGKLMCLEQFALCGNYNVGLTGFASTSNARGFVDWWMHESIDTPECNMGAGRFAEQGWFRFVADYMDKVHICRDQGVNYAFWRYDAPNDVVFTEEEEYFVYDGQNRGYVPLRMFHYGALDFNNLHRVAVHHTRCEAGPGLMHLLNGYKSRVEMVHA